MVQINKQNFLRLRNHLTSWSFRHYRTVVMYVSLTLIVMYLGIIAIQVLSHALDFDGFAMDGAFQSLNPLRRLAAGQVIGRDFQFFHGLGIPLLHYPLFRLLGGDLTAEEVVRWLLLPVLFAASTITFFYAVTKRWWLTWTTSAVVMFFCLWKLPGAVYPENSSLGLRSLTSVFIMATMLSRGRLSGKHIGRIGQFVDLYQIVMSLLLTIAFLCGTEQGIAAGIAYTIVSLRFPRDVALKARAIALGKTVLLATVWLLGLLTIITLGHPLRPLLFTLVDLPSDQGWYFGSPPNDFIEYSTFFKLFWHPFNLVVVSAAVLLFGLLRHFRRHPSVEPRLEALTFGLLAGVAALISMFGYYAAAQLIPLARMCVLVAVALGAFCLPSVVKHYRLKPRNVYPAAACLLIIIGGLLASTMARATLQQFQVIKLAKHGYHHFVTRTDTENLGIGWQSTMYLVMPQVNADNYATVVPKNDAGFVNGISLNDRAVAVKRDKYAPLLKHGQVVYLPLSGRHKVAKAMTQGDTVLVYLETARDMNINDSEGGRMIIGERLDKNTTRIWSAYTALFESEMNTIQPTPGYDYIIHALGKNARQNYLNIFDKTQPEYVTTMRRDYAVFEEWVQYTSWDFYQRVIDNYEPVVLTGSHILWQKRPDHGWKQPDYASASKPMKIDGNRLALPANNSDKPKLVVVTVNYKPTGLATKLPLASKSPRYLLAPRNTISAGAETLPPYLPQRSFPVYLKPHSSNAYLEASVHSLAPGAGLDISSAHYQTPAIDDGTMKALIDQGGPITAR